MLSLYVAGYPEESSLFYTGSISFIPLVVGIVEGRSFIKLCLFLCYLALCELQALYKGNGHASRLERIPSDVKTE